MGTWLLAALLGAGLLAAGSVYLARTLALMVLAEGTPVRTAAPDVADTGHAGAVLLDGGEDAHFVTPDGRRLPIRGHGAPVDTARFLDDGRTLVTVDRDGAIRLTDTEALGLVPADPDGGFLSRLQDALWQDFGRPLGKFALGLMLERGEQLTVRDCGECPEMIVVPAGSFVMGSPASEEGRYGNEGPQRTVTIAEAFAVGKFEVTFAEWDACVAGGGCNGYRPGDAGWGRGNRPVIFVSWNDAQAYVQWLSSKTGKRYRLLSEGEWEYLARAGTTTPYAFSREAAPVRIRAHKTDAVGSFPANRFGLHEMHGNVWEWLTDCGNETYAGAPSDGSAWRSGICSFRALRGGAWQFDPNELRSANRGRSNPTSRYISNGFRVARTL